MNQAAAQVPQFQAQPQQASVIPFPIQPVPQPTPVQPAAFMAPPAPGYLVNPQWAMPAPSQPPAQYWTQQDVQIPTTQLQGYPVTQQLPPVQAQNPNIPQSTPPGQAAGIREIAEHFGSLEAAAYSLNGYALQLENTLNQVAARYEAMEKILSDPDILANYYLGMLKEMGELPEQQAQQPPMQQPSMQQPAMQQLPAPAWNNQAIPSFSQIPPNERWKYIDTYGRSPSFWQNTAL